MRGVIVERIRGFSSWIQFGFKSLRRLLQKVEKYCRDGRPGSREIGTDVEKLWKWRMRWVLKEDLRVSKLVGSFFLLDLRERGGKKIVTKGDLLFPLKRVDSGTLGTRGGMLTKALKGKRKMGEVGLAFS